MTSADKFGVIFTIAFVAAMIAIMGGALQPDSTPSTPSVTAPAQTYSPPPAPVETQPTVAPQATTQPSSSENLKYTIRGGIVDSISQDEHHNAVKIIMDSRLDGQLTITLTSDSVVPFDDGTYFVTVDGEEVDFTQVGKKLTIDFMANSQKIMIFGEGHTSDGHDDKDDKHESMMAAEAAAAEKAAADKAAADKAAADKAAAAEKAAADKAAAEAAAAEKAAKAPMAITIEPVAGSGAPGCEPDCYSPTTATISAGGTVTFSNTDTAPHTATSGTAAGGPDGAFDTSLIMANASFDIILSDSGNYPYFCMVHPWMEGTVIVE